MGSAPLTGVPAEVTPPGREKRPQSAARRYVHTMSLFRRAWVRTGLRFAAVSVFAPPIMLSAGFLVAIAYGYAVVAGAVPEFFSSRDL